MRFEFFGVEEGVKEGLCALRQFYPFEEGVGGDAVYAYPTGGALRVEKSAGKTSIFYPNRAAFFLGFSYCMQYYDKESFSIEGSNPFSAFGIMRDCARNGAINEKSFQTLVVSAALMGYTYIELYVEDLLKIDSLTYLAHARPAYDREKIKRMEAFAGKFGIELVPSVQALAHLPALFRHDQFTPIRDNGGILLCGEEKTYAFLETVLAWVAESFSTRRVNIGMDEAHTMCMGAYLDKNGYVEDKGKVFTDHLKRVLAICDKYGLKASMFSDMFFRIGLKNPSGSSYEGVSGRHFDETFASSVPQNVTLVFWDYNHSDREFYDERIDMHRELTGDVAFACGGWNWKGFAPFNTIAENNAMAALKSCKEKGIADFKVTLWGDNGAECSTFAVISTLLRLAEQAYFGERSIEELNERCLFLFGNTYEEFQNTEDANATRAGAIKDGKDVNPSKYLLYADPLLGICDAHARADMEETYKAHAAKYAAYAKRGGRFAYVFEVLKTLCEALESKATLGLKLADAYKRGDKEGLRALATKEIPECIARLEGFYEAFRVQWMTENEYVGFEITDVRLGGLIHRLKNVARTLLDYADGRVAAIGELEQPRLPYSYKNKIGEDRVINNYAVVASGSQL